MLSDLMENFRLILRHRNIKSRMMRDEWHKQLLSERKKALQSGERQKMSLQGPRHEKPNHFLLESRARILRAFNIIIISMSKALHNNQITYSNNAFI